MLCTQQWPHKSDEELTNIQTYKHTHILKTWPQGRDLIIQGKLQLILVLAAGRINNLCKISVKKKDFNVNFQDFC